MITTKIQIITDNHITGRDTPVEQAEATITGARGHLAEHVTRTRGEVQLSDVLVALSTIILVPDRFTIR